MSVFIKGQLYWGGVCFVRQEVYFTPASQEVVVQFCNYLDNCASISLGKALSFPLRSRQASLTDIPSAALHVHIPMMSVKEDNFSYSTC